MLRPNPPSTRLRSFIVCLLAVSWIILGTGNITAQTDSESERHAAFELTREGKFAEALAKFEKLVASNPQDGNSQFGLGLTLLATAKNISDESTRRQARIRARNAFLRAKESGVSENYADLLDSGLASIAPDGTEVSKFSSDPEIDKAMQEGEAAFARRDYDGAIAAYQRALGRNPKLYNAALFIGDAYFGKKENDKAAEWYGRAIAISPDQETAYRYWSDVLLRSGRMEEARIKAIEAIVAEPYNRMSYRALIQWAQENSISVGHPTIEPPAASATSAPGPASYWSLYHASRSAFPATFKKEFPNEPAYRHTLKEEASALRAVAEAIASDLKSAKLKSVEDESLANLLKLHQSDLIEAYVLFVTPDEGIARDYDEYRRTHRDSLKRYWTEIAIAKAK